MNPELTAKTTPGAVTDRINGNLSLFIPAGTGDKYRLAQFDDFHQTARSHLHWCAPLTLSLRARCSNPKHAGTWGFGLWNDPFSASLGIAGSARRLPALPNCAWFFFASPPNHLEIYDRYPAQGFLAATFSAPLIPPAALLFGLPQAPLLAFPFSSRWLRKLLRYFIRQDAAIIDINPGDWHAYRLEWLPDRVSFYVDENRILQTNTVPNGRLGLVLWVDNQYAAFPPDGRLRFGTLTNPVETRLEISNLTIQ